MQKDQRQVSLKTSKTGDQPISVPIDKITDPTVLASGAIASIHNCGSETFDAAKDRTKETLAKIKSGNLEDLEAILVNQVYVLNTLFSKLVTQGSKSLTEPAVLRSLPNHPKTMLNVALKAQTQCRATVQTISDLKNPKKTTFIKNQLNNVQMEVEGIKEQLEDAEHGSKELDYRTEAKTISVDPKMETVEVINRSQDSRRETS